MSKRPAQAMADDVRAALRDGGVEADYRARPHYQRNDYLGWIGDAKQDGTRDRRIARMVAELKQGGVYMGMTHAPSAKA
ncbi:MAG TPA: YdeI/OmpD-associated family protein [Allosphingosinicella sp.]|nr:YdeI/OmpD-associated family protein [Allosphingosinicella sp.]